jgi:uncharacterized LabA/DUF88 family protein
VGKNVAVFVDVANIFYAAKAAGVDIDYVTLLKSAVAGRDFVRAYAYTGLDPDNENQRNFHSFLSRHGYKVVSKDIRKYGDGKVKANLDIELVVDMLKTARNLDVAIVVSGDGDFAPAIRAVQEMGVRVEVISFRGNTSSDLIDVADQFTDIIQIAKVEKGSSRSGRRVADVDEDLSMTEVPDKLTEGTGRGRGRTTGRGRGRAVAAEAEREPVAATGRAAARGGRGRAAAAEAEPAAAPGAPTGLVALPGEKLSKVARPTPAASSAEAEEVVEEGVARAEEHLEHEGEAPRRRRRRGGRGRGRGRGRGEGAAAELEGLTVDRDRLGEGEEEEAELVVSTPRAPRPGAFGSVWDSQIGQSRAPSAESTPFDVDEEEEPAIPEYLIAEQRRGSGRGGRSGGRGGRGGAYSVAIERERFGRAGVGMGRYPDVSGRGGGAGRGGRDGRRGERATSPARPERERPSGGRSEEPWSEVPPELEAMLRAQLARRSDERPAPARRPASVAEAPAAVPSATEAAVTGAAVTEAAAPKPPTGRGRRMAPKPAGSASTDAGPTEAAAAPKPRATPRRKTAPAEPAAGAAAAEAPGAPTKRRTTARSRTAVPDEAEGSAAETTAPKRRTTRKKVETPEA